MTTITVKEVAMLTGVSVSKIHAIVRSEKLGFPKTLDDRARGWVFDKAEVAEWLKTNDPKKIKSGLHGKGYYKKLSVFDDNKVGYVTELFQCAR